MLASTGAVLLVLGWWFVSGEARMAAQLPYLASCSFPGAALLISGIVLISRPRHAPSDPRVDLLVALLTEAEAQTAETSTLVNPLTPVTHGLTDFVVVSGAKHYHRPDCELVRGKHTRRHDAAAAPGALAACPLCKPTP